MGQAALHLACATPQRHLTQSLCRRPFALADAGAVSRTALCADLRHLSAHELKAFERAHAGARRFRALDRHVIEKEPAMLFVLMKLLRREHDRENRHLGLELHLHESVDHGLSDELVTIDAAIDDQPAGDDGTISTALGQELRMQWNFECSRHLDDIDSVGANAVLLDGAKKGLAPRSTMSLCQQD